ncbi:MAG: Rpn family recombination-promoting nuclease/putative transposase [Spirochaetaceae bacterium]|jgi:predicted transposase/invertase (TIGR01784 family)|nr:Rpn family recombination-promoting nuclease/putative transposase [Spirochaetaceae bacterium]
MIQISENDEVIDICLDNVFKAVFTKNTPESVGALSNLLSAVIGRDVSVIAVIANEPAIDNLRDRQIRFDINCKTDGGKLMNVEMSLNPDKFEPVRLEFYAGKLFTGQDIKGAGKTYSDLKDAYQIAFLVNGRFFADGDFLHAFEYYDQQKEVSLGGRTHIITVELAKLEYLKDTPVPEMTAPERWAFYFRYITDREKRGKVNEIIAFEEGIEMASEVLMTISRDEAERARLMSEYKYELDTQSRIAYARQEGEQRGGAEGEQRGRREGALEIARKMKKRNAPLEQIAEDTGLSWDVIAKL